MSGAKPALQALSALKLTLMAKKVRAEAQAVLNADPIAVVGMACRVPGGGDTPERFWELLVARKDAVREVPAERWNADAWYDSDAAAPAKATTKWGGFLESIDGFDAGYFGILPREAERMDPQQRLCLEVAIEALDDAGLTRERLRGSRTGVFVASYHNDYAQLQYDDVEDIDLRTLTGTLHSVLTGRLSYLLDLRGPSISIDTACSSSLVAIHLACQSLRSGETDAAVAGGVSLMITPEIVVSLSKVGFMAPDGRCKTFDASANGFGRGEGCGIVVLKRLSDAVADGDRVLAVVRGSSVNQDGHSTLLAAPSGPAQEALIREALANAQLEPERVGYVETHGTGTALGDPIEIEALAATIGRRAADAGPCWLGAVKANLGHLEAAAGVAGVIKAVLALRHQAIPPQVHFERLNPHMSLDGTRMAVPTRVEPWRPGAQPRCAAVSSFGVSGTNAHVLVEEAPALPGAQREPVDAPRILPLSAQSPAALRALAQSWIDFLGATPDAVADICYTASLRRSHLDHRVAVVGHTREQLAARLGDFVGEAAAAGAVPGRRPASAAPRLAFVFSGQGPQWFAMGRELLAEEPVFRDALAACDALLRPLSGWSLLEELAQPEERSRLARTDVAQPALFSLQVALAALWKSWGVRPEAVVGHSVGEIAALHVAGVLALPEAIRVAWHRGRIMQEATGLGRMASVALAPAEAAALVAPHGDRLAVAAINSPRSVVLSGDPAALEAVLAVLAARGVSHRMLPVDYAFHSAQMAPFQRRLADELGTVATGTPGLDIYSTVTGGLARDMRFDAAYLGRNVREPVRLASAIEALSADGFDVFVEIGPHPVLAGSLAECLAEREHAATIVHSLRRGKPERETMLQAAAALYTAGLEPDWEAFQRAQGPVVSLPAYAWQRKRHWIRPRPLRDGARITEGSHEAASAWLADHRIFGHLVLPGAAVIDAFLAAARGVLGTPQVGLDGFAMERAVFLPDANPGSARWQVVAAPTGEGRVELHMNELVAGEEGAAPSWRRVASASAARGEGIAPSIEMRGTEGISTEAVYARFAALGIGFGPAFRVLEEIERGEGVAQAWVQLPEGIGHAGAPHALHPLLIDGAMQLCTLAAPRAADGELPAAARVPLGADHVYLAATVAPPRVRVRARVRESGGPTLVADVVLEAPGGERVAAIEGLRLAPAERETFLAAAENARPQPLYSVAWHDAAEAQAQPGREAGAWLILADRGGTGEALARALEASGSRCSLAFAGAGFERVSPQRFVVDPADAAGFARLLESIDAPAALKGVVHLWSLDDAPLALEGDVSGDADLPGVGSALHLVQALVGARGAGVPALHLVTRGAQVATGDEPAASLQPRGAGLWGLARVIQVEHPELHVRTVDLDPAPQAGEAAHLASLLAQPGDAPAAVALRSGARRVPRLERHRSQARRSAVHAQVVRPGTLDGVELRPVARRPLAADEVRLQVLAAGLNFRDVLFALGMYPGAVVPLGAECAGVVVEAGSAVRELVPGQRVIAYAAESLGTECIAAAACVAPMPAGLRVEEAAGLPVAYLTASLGLERIARLQRGERVLIHAAAGGVGLAAVQVAQRLGAEVFATAGSDEKRTLLRSMGVAHVMDSRTLAFADQVLAATGGEGVHVVLNSLAGEFIAASLRVVREGGRFLEIGKRGILTPEAAARARPDVAYRAYDLAAEAQADPGLVRPMLDALLAALADGSLRPLPVTTFPLHALQDAMRLMAQARHIGKIVLATGAAPAGIAGDATYWITGGLGAIGLETARWLASRGARHLVLTGRSAPGASATAVLRELEAAGVAVRVMQADAADRAQMRRVLGEIDSAMPRLRGVIHAAGALHDAVLQGQRWDQCREVLRGKAHGAWVLHQLTRERPLDFFVLYSAAGVLLGPSGQGAYPAANAQLDALAHARRRMGLPALSVAWGAWAGGGMMDSFAAQGRDVWAARGVGRIAAAEGFAALERLMRDDATCAAVLPIDWTRFLAQLPEGLDREYFRSVGPAATEAAAAPSRGPSVAERLHALPVGDRRDALVAHLAERALGVLGLDATTRVDPRSPLKEIGLDSLMAVELRNALSRSTGQVLPATLLFDYPTLEGLAGHLAHLLGLELEAPRDSRPAARAEAVKAKAQVAALSEAEAEALLLAELETDTQSGTP